MIRGCAQGLQKWRRRKNKLKKSKKYSKSRKSISNATNYEDGDVLLVYESTTDVKKIKKEKKIPRRGTEDTVTSITKSHHTRKIKEKHKKMRGDKLRLDGFKHMTEMDRDPPPYHFGKPPTKDFTSGAQKKESTKKKTPPPKPPLPENYYRYTTSHECQDNFQNTGAAVAATQVNAQTTSYQVLQPFEHDEAGMAQTEKPAFRQQSPHHVVTEQPRASVSEKSAKSKSTLTQKSTVRSHDDLSKEMSPYTSIVLEDSNDWEFDARVYGHWSRDSIPGYDYSFSKGQDKTTTMSEGMQETSLLENLISAPNVPFVEKNTEESAPSEEVKQKRDSDTSMARSWTDFFTNLQLVAAIQKFLKELDSTISNEVVGSFSTKLGKKEAAKAIEVLFTALDMSMIDKESGAPMPLNQGNASSAISAFLVELDKSLSAKEGCARDRATRATLLVRKKWDPDNSLKAFLFLLDEIQPSTHHNIRKISSTKVNEEGPYFKRSSKGSLEGECHGLRSIVQSLLRNLDPSLSEDDVSYFIGSMAVSQLEEAVEAFLIHLGLEIDGEKTDQCSLPQSNEAIGVLLKKLDSKELTRVDDTVDLAPMAEHSSNYIHLYDKRIIQLKPLDPDLSDRAINTFMNEISSLESPIGVLGGASEQMNENRMHYVSGASICTPLSQCIRQTPPPDTGLGTALTRHSMSSLHSPQERRGSNNSRKKTDSVLNSSSCKSDSCVMVGKKQLSDDRVSVEVASERRKSRQIFKKSSIISTQNSKKENSKSSLDKLADAQIKYFESSSNPGNLKSSDKYTTSLSKTSSSSSSYTTLKQCSDKSSKSSVPSYSKKTRGKTEEDYSSLRTVPLKPDGSVKYTLVRRHTLSGGEVSAAVQLEQEQQWAQFDVMEISPRYQLDDILFSPRQGTQSPQQEEEVVGKNSQSPPDHQPAQSRAEQMSAAYELNFGDNQDTSLLNQSSHTGDLSVRAMEEDVALRRFIKQYQKAQDSGFSFTGVSSDFPTQSEQELQESDPNIDDSTPLKQPRPLNPAFDFAKELKKILPTPQSLTAVSHSSTWSDTIPDPYNHPNRQNQESTETERPMQPKTRKIKRKTTTDEESQPIVQVITVTERRTLSCKDPLETKLLENSSPRQTEERHDSSERQSTKCGVNSTIIDTDLLHDKGLSTKLKSAVSLPLPSEDGLVDLKAPNPSFHSLQRHFHHIPSHLHGAHQSSTAMSSTTSTDTWHTYSLPQEQEKNTTTSSLHTANSMVEHSGESSSQPLMLGSFSSIDSSLLQMIALMPEKDLLTQVSSSVTEDSSVKRPNRDFGLEESSTTSSNLTNSIDSPLINMDSMAVHKASSYNMDGSQFSNSPFLLEQRVRLQDSPLINHNLSSDDPLLANCEQDRMLQTSSSQIFLDNTESGRNTSHSSNKLVQTSTSPEDTGSYSQSYSEFVQATENFISTEEDAR